LSKRRSRNRRGGARGRSEKKTSERAAKRRHRFREGEKEPERIREGRPNRNNESQGERRDFFPSTRAEARQGRDREMRRSGEEAWNLEHGRKEKSKALFIGRAAEKERRTGLGLRQKADLSHKGGVKEIEVDCREGKRTARAQREKPAKTIAQERTGPKELKIRVRRHPRRGESRQAKNENDP